MRLFILLALCGTFSASAQSVEYNVLELPAVKSDLASESLIFSIERFHDRHFATGHKGHILYSDDGGDNWTQAEVPVRSSILDIDFPTPEVGWAVGHEGVILHSSDGGETWVKQFDGERYGDEGLAYYKGLATSDPDNDYYPLLVEEMEFAISQGADKPFFGVHFHTDKFGHAGGAYGMLLRTQDGGKSWEPVLHNVENDGFYHIFDFAPLPDEGKFFLSGEAGLFIIGDIATRTGKQVETAPFQGSFFTVIDTPEGGLVVGGLRGRMFRTVDAGVTWTAVNKPPSAAIVDIARLEDGRLVAVSIGGQIFISSDDGRNFKPLPLSNGGRLYAVAEGSNGSILVGGPKGIQKLKLPE
ncbi:MAG: glycosyl hydrolase [Halioglobus sp.]|nr:glycosyl hydrolase [Halioglobus sp.]